MERCQIQAGGLDLWLGTIPGAPCERRGYWGQERRADGKIQGKEFSIRAADTKKCSQQLPGYPVQYGDHRPCTFSCRMGNSAACLCKTKTRVAACPGNPDV